MGLKSGDKRPQGLSLKETYAAICKWHSGNIDYFEHQEWTNPSDIQKAQLAFMKALPPPNKATEAEMKVVLQEALTGNMEWAYHASNGEYKMGAYVEGLMDQFIDLPFRLSNGEIEELKGSKLWPHLGVSRHEG